MHICMKIVEETTILINKRNKSMRFVKTFFLNCPEPSIEPFKATGNKMKREHIIH
ncbi:hypothetical protein DEHRE_00895 [Dehalobacter restrictus DSM 9455]|uniref:Uncharacterized protein n=1 Tax=Dehalobacter restrictus (strain DSM 9455 / PER-K23) TaxID=871738 RepID=A0ABM5P9K6_DEHRP|nr:hypothetical protein DEHRE_00895 [Dehalobacter restrictus DSM 9455]